MNCIRLPSPNLIILWEYTDFVDVVVVRKERNFRIFDGTTSDTDSLAREIDNICHQFQDCWNYNMLGPETHLLVTKNNTKKKKFQKQV